MTLVCENCGFVNEPGSTHCKQCGKELSLRPPARAKETDTSGSRLTFGNRHPARSMDRDRTMTGLLLAGLGLFLAWIPYVMYVGEFLLLIGVIMIFSGRRGFSVEHERNVGLSLALFVIMIIVVIVVSVMLASSILSIASSNASPSDALNQLSSVFSAYTALLIVISILAALSYILLPFALLDKNWRYLLIIAFILMIGIAIMNYFVVSSIIRNLINNAGIQSFQSIASNAQGQVSLYNLLAAIPYIILGVVFLKARSRVDLGEV